MYIYIYIIINTIISNARLKLEKNQANINQHPDTELLLFENNSHSYIYILKNSCE